MKFNKLFKIGVAFLLFLFIGCSGSGGNGYGGGVESQDSAFLYNAQKTEISGYFTIKLDDILVKSTAYTQEVKLANFRVDIACGKIGQSVSPDPVTFTDNTSQKVDVTINLNGACNASEFEVKADKIVVTTYTNKSIPPTTEVMDWSRKFSVQNNYSSDSSISDTREIVLNPSIIEINNPGEIKEIEVKAFNVNKELLEKDLTLSSVYTTNNDTKDYGKVNVHTLKTSKEGSVKFTYIAPTKISHLDGKVAYINVTDNQSKLKAKVKIVFKPLVKLSTRYGVKLVSPNKMGIDKEEYISIKVVDLDNSQAIVSSDLVTNMSIKIRDFKLLKFENGSNIYTYSKASSKTLLVKSGTKAGLAMVEVSGKVNGENIYEEFPITILSGPINSISIVYKETLDYQKTKPMFTNIYTLHAVDKYANPVNRGDKIYVGAIFGVTKTDGGEYLYSPNGGSISNYQGSVSFTIAQNLGNTDLISSSYKNSLVVLANQNRKNPDYIGGWDIKGVSGNSLSLVSENYTISFTSVSGLTYLIGSEKRYNKCSASIAVGSVDSNDNLYQIGADGTAEIKLTYDPFFVGNTVYIYANSFPNDETPDSKKRVGVAIRDILIGRGVEEDDTNAQSYKGEAGQFGYLEVKLREKDSLAPVMDARALGIVEGDCHTAYNNPNFDISRINTGCNGTFYVPVVFDKNGTCSAKWSGGFLYDDGVGAISDESGQYNFD